MEVNVDAVRDAPEFFYRIVVEGRNVDDAKILLKDLQSFRRLMTIRGFAIHTVDKYPEFKDLVR